MLTQITNNLTLYLSSWHVYNRWMLSTAYSNCTLQHNQGCFLGFLNASQLAGSGSINGQGLAFSFGRVCPPQLPGSGSLNWQGLALSMGRVWLSHLAGFAPLNWQGLASLIGRVWLPQHVTCHAAEPHLSNASWTSLCRAQPCTQTRHCNSPQRK